MIKNLKKKYPNIKLGINCVNGKVGTLTTFLLSNDSYFITYGGLSKKKLEIPASNFIFKNITYKGIF